MRQTWSGSQRPWLTEAAVAHRARMAKSGKFLFWNSFLAFFPWFSWFAFFLGSVGRLPDQLRFGQLSLPDRPSTSERPTHPPATRPVPTKADGPDRLFVSNASNDGRSQ